MKKLNKPEEKNKRSWWWWVLIILILLAIISSNEKKECVEDCDLEKEDCRLDAQLYDWISYDDCDWDYEICVDSCEGW